MDTNKGKYYNIVRGPGRDTLFDACKYTYDRRSFVAVDFEVALVPPFRPGGAFVAMKIKNLHINGIEHDGNGGVAFMLKGTCKADLNPHTSTAPEWCNYRFEAYYNTERKTGHIVFTK